MLTKDDLKEFDKIVRKRVRQEIETEVENAKVEIQHDIKMSEIRILGEINNVKDRLKNLEIKTSKIQKDLKFAINFLDKEELRIQKRVEKIETHPHIIPVS